MDRFQPPGLHDDSRISAYCAWCGGEIYVGDEFTSYRNGDKTHIGHCENEYVVAELGITRETAA